MSSRGAQTGGQRFSVPDAAASERPQAAAAARAAHGVDALLALQSFDVAGERRRRSVQRGRSLLDALESLKLSMIDGTVPEPVLTRLRTVIADERALTGDTALDDLLSAIELRAEVELAKRQPSPKI